MKIRVGFEMIYDLPQPTPLIAVLGTHFTRASDVIVPDHLTTSPSVPITPYRDGFGNWCSRIVAPAGRMRLAADGTVRDSGMPDVVVPSAAVQRGPNGLFVWAVSGKDIAEPRPIETAQTYDNLTIVTSGLSGGERVVTDGQYRLQRNAPVTFTSPQIAGSAGNS